MEEVRFENEQEFARPSAAAQGPRGLTALVMKWGLAKDEKTAQYVLLGITGMAVTLAIAISLVSGAPTPKALPLGTTVVNTPGVPPHLLAPLP